MWHSLVPELLEIIFLCLLADNDPTYLCMRRVCTYWYDIYLSLIHRGYVMSRKTILQNLWKRPDVLRSVAHNGDDKIVKNMIKCYARLNDHESCETFLKSVDKHELAVKVCIQTNFQSMLQKLKIPKRMFLKRREVAYIFYYEMEQYYDKIDYCEWMALRIPSESSLKWIQSRMNVDVYEIAYNMFPDRSDVPLFIDIPIRELVNRWLWLINYLAVNIPELHDEMLEILHDTGRTYLNRKSLSKFLKYFTKIKVGYLEVRTWVTSDVYTELIDFYSKHVELTNPLHIRFSGKIDYIAENAWVHELSVLGYTVVYV
jgi:hypothetical protein